MKKILATLNFILIFVGYQFITSVFSFIISDEEGASRIVTVPFRAFSLIICIAVILLNIKKSIKLTKEIKLLFVYWALLIIRFIYDFYYRSDVHVSSDYRIQLILYMVPMTIIPMYSILKSYNVINLNKTLVWTLILSIISILITFLTNQSFQEKTIERVNANAALSSINSGNLGLTVILLSVYFIVYSDTSKIKKILLFICGFLGFLIMLRSGSRGPILSLIVIGTIWILGSTKRIALNSIIFAIISLIIYINLDEIFNVIGSISPILENRLNRAGGDQLDDRIPLYQYAINSFLENPIFGKNFAIYSTDGTAIYPHNMILDSLMQLGLVGFTIITYIILRTLILVFKLVKTKDRSSWIGLILIQNIVGLMLSSSLYYRPIVSILIVYLFIINASKHHDNINLKNQTENLRL